MTEQTPGRKPSSMDQILDLLLDALAERQKARRGEAPLLPPSPTREAPPPSPLASPIRTAEPVPSSQPLPTEQEVSPPALQASPKKKASEEKRPATLVEAARRAPAPHPETRPRPGEKGWQPPARLPSIQMSKFLSRLAVGIAALVVLVNIPVKSHGVSLARILPDTASLIIRDGLVLKGTAPEIYILQDDRLRWISSMDVFEHLELSWADVHVVDDAFLKQFQVGNPIHLIVKCDASPHIYALENGQKRWIKDIDTFTAEGYVWEDVQSVSCSYLRNLPDGLPIPEDAGAPPQP